MLRRRYLTTAIDFPNAAPHMGHVMEKILADVIVRWSRLSGYDVRFHIGTDENGIKIQQTAKAAGKSPRQLVNENAPLFESLFTRLDISFDYFIRTANEHEHWPTVQALWKKLKNVGMLEKRTYTGLYCTGCERFVTEKDLINGLCPDHKIQPEKVSEENWFYLLSKSQKKLDTLLKKKEYDIVPSFRAAETINFLDQGLEDISFSRSKKTLSWGVPVPDDPDQVMYVWCDNLTSYISSLHWFSSDQMTEWWNDAEVTHVIGKDIARFHALNWPAMLIDAGVKPPDRLLIHGFMTSEGQKMSKSLGNVVQPEEILARFSGNPDPIRFYLSHEIPVGNDGDFSWKRFEELYDARLRNQLGNLLNRVLVMINKAGGAIEQTNDDLGLKAQLTNCWNKYTKNMDSFEISVAIENTMFVVSAGNQMFNDAAPWKEKDEHLKLTKLSAFVELLRHISLMLLPFIPATAQKISKQLNVPYEDNMLKKSFVITEKMKQWGSQTEWKSVGTPEILFPPLEKK